jgi:hypothetical protein
MTALRLSRIGRAAPKLQWDPTPLWGGRGREGGRSSVRGAIKTTTLKIPSSLYAVTRTVLEYYSTRNGYTRVYSTKSGFTIPSWGDYDDDPDNLFVGVRRY